MSDVKFYTCSLDNYDEDCKMKNTCKRYTHFDKEASARIFNYCKKSNYSAYIKDDEIKQDENSDNQTNG